MRFLSLLPYMLVLPALAIGFSVGWLLRARNSPKSDAPPPPDAADVSAAQKRIQEIEAELAEAETQLAHLNKNLVAARKRLTVREEEHRQLLNQLRERRTDMNEAAAELTRLEAELETRREQIDQTLTDINSHTDELDMLKELNTNYRSEIDRLAQHVQWQDGEISRLRQTMNQRSADITDATALLAQRETELEHLIRMRRRLDLDIRSVTEQLRTTRHDPRQATTQPIPIDDLTCLSDLTDAHARLLREAGIISFTQMAQARPSDLEAIIGISDGPLPDVRRWIAEARRLLTHDSDSQEPPILPPPTSS